MVATSDLVLPRAPTLALPLPALLDLVFGTHEGGWRLIVRSGAGESDHKLEASARGAVRHLQNLGIAACRGVGDQRVFRESAGRKSDGYPRNRVRRAARRTAPSGCQNL